MTTIESSSRFWDRIAPKYAKQPIKNESAYQEKLAITRSHCTPGTRMLELGCGTGKTAVTLAPHVASVIASDYAPEMLKLGKAFAEERGVTNITFESKDAMALSGEQEFDLILAHSLTHLLEDPDAFLRQIKSHLSPTGKFITNTVCLKDSAMFFWPIAKLGRLFKLLPHISFFSHEDFEAMLDANGFEVLSCYRPAKGTSFFVTQLK